MIFSFLTYCVFPQKPAAATENLLLDQLFPGLVLSLLYDCHLSFVSDPDQAFCQIDLG